MGEYLFTLEIDIPPERVTDAFVDAAHEAGFDDGTVGVFQGQPHITVSREAESLEAAIRSALVGCAALGVPVKLILMNPVDFPEKP